MRNKFILIFLLFGLISFPGVTYSNDFSVPLNASNAQWEHQETFSSHKMPNNLMDLFIKEDEDRYYFRCTTYGAIKQDKDFYLSFWFDTDQQVNTGLRGEDCSPIGDDLFLAISISKTGDKKGVIALYDEEGEEFVKKEILDTGKDFCVLKRSFQFSISKKYFPSPYGFDYLIMILYPGKDANSDVTDTYPGCGEKLTYPPGSKAQPTH